jgi:serpin B
VLYRLGAQAYAVNVPWRGEEDDEDPRVVDLLWAPSDGAARRVVFGDLEADDLQACEPPDLLLPAHGRGRYEEILSLGCSWRFQNCHSEPLYRAGRLATRAVRIHEFTYHFRSEHPSPSEKVCAIGVRLSPFSPGLRHFFVQEAAAGRVRSAEPLPAAARDLVAANTAFAFRLFTALLQEDPDRNCFLSPIGIGFALQILLNGAGGRTREAMAKVLHLPGISTEAANSANAALRASLEAPSPDVRVTLSNSLWANTGITVAPLFQETLRRDYGGEAITLSFRDPSAPATINSWIHRATNGRINGSVSSSDLEPPNDLLLTNAVYFRGAWSLPFDRKATRPGLFTLPDGRQKELPMMQAKDIRPYYKGHGFQAIRLPYGNGRIAMILFVPRRDSSLREFLARLNPKRLEHWLGQLAEREVRLVLPRFKVEYRADLVEPLAALGMGTAFAEGADFHPMGLDRYPVTQARHLTAMEVNEEGTEAAGLTMFYIAASDGPPKVVVDRPFFCLIQDSETESILFMGAIADPQPIPAA